MSREWAGICSLCEGCVLHAGHEEACRVADMEEEEYEVEAILRQRAKRNGASLIIAARALPSPVVLTRARAHFCLPSGVVEYFVKWLNWPEDDCTWETEDAFEFAADILSAWKAKDAKKKKAPPTRKRKRAIADSSDEDDDEDDTPMSEKEVEEESTPAATTKRQRAARAASPPIAIAIEVVHGELASVEEAEALPVIDEAAVSVAADSAKAAAAAKRVAEAKAAAEVAAAEAAAAAVAAAEAKKLAEAKVAAKVKAAADAKAAAELAAAQARAEAADTADAMAEAAELAAAQVRAEAADAADAMAEAAERAEREAQEASDFAKDALTTAPVAADGEAVEAESSGSDEGGASSPIERLPAKVMMPFARAAAKPTAPGRTTPQKVGVRKTVSWSPNLDRSGGR